MKKEEIFDVIIIGGSYAGLAAAMSLGRALRKTLIIDSGVPCNRQTPHSHNFLTRDGETPKQISTVARHQVAQYDTVSFFDDMAVQGEKTDSGYAITTWSGKTFSSKKVIFATGLRDLYPDIPGFAECWGISVIHCPYCHGYEYRTEKTAIFANGERAIHLSGLVNNLTADLTILTNGPADFTGEQWQSLKQRNIRVIADRIAAIAHHKGYVTQLNFKNGESLEIKALYAAIPFVQHSGIPAAIGCELSPQGHILTDGSHKTTVPGIFACGDNSSPMRSVSNAVAAGSFTGAVVNGELVTEQIAMS